MLPGSYLLQLHVDSMQTSCSSCCCNPILLLLLLLLLCCCCAAAAAESSNASAKASKHPAHLRCSAHTSHVDAI